MVSQQPQVSIVLPVYNGEQYLEESIRSCCEQTFQNWELIIIDDCSTDDTPAIIQSWATQDKRIRYYRNKNNLKLPVSLNIGFSYAKGNYFTWTSDDNRYLSEAFNSMTSILDTDLSIDIVYADYRIIDELGERKENKKVKEPEELLFTNGVNGCFLYRRSVHEKLKGYDKSIYLCEDYDFWLRALAAGFNFKAWHQCLYEYRIHASSLTALRQQQIVKMTLVAKQRSVPKVSADRFRKSQSFEYAAAQALRAGMKSQVLISTIYILRYQPMRIFEKCIWRFIYGLFWR